MTVTEPRAERRAPAAAGARRQGSGPALHDGPIIHTAGVSKQFNDEYAVRDLTFDVPNGTIFGYIGPSGSGKTTTIRLLTGIYPPSAGEVRVFGQSPARFRAGTRERIGYMPQHFVLYPDLSVWENLNFAASIYGMGPGRGKRLHAVLDFVELGEHSHKLARDISGGMQRRLSLAATLVHDPTLIFLDEPTAGIDPVLRRKFWDHFRTLQSEGRTLFITTQYVGETAYCDMVGIMGEGRLLAVDRPENLRRRAFGGDVVDVKTTERVDYQTLARLRELPFVRRAQRGDADNSLRLIVDDAGTAIPALISWAQNQGIGTESVQEYVPPFDDVFVDIVKQASTPEASAAATAGGQEPGAGRQ